MWAGTVSIGLTMPGRMRPSVPRWQRLYLRPLPHQQGSFEVGSRSGAWDMGTRIRPEMCDLVAQPPGGATVSSGFGARVVDGVLDVVVGTVTVNVAFAPPLIWLPDSSMAWMRTV